MSKIPLSRLPSLLLAAAMTLTAGIAAAPPADPASQGTVGLASAVSPFRLRVGASVSELELLSHFELPGTAIELEALGGAAPFTAQAEGGVLTPAGSGRWTFSPMTGHAVVVLKDAAGRVLRRRFFGLTPYDGGDRVGAFRIGEYPAEPLRHLEAYRRPSGLLAVRHADLELAVSPHFRLGQFLCKQDGGAPEGGEVAYVLLRTELLVALERLLEGIHEAGIPASTLFVMSGFRTPQYNRAIGNDTIYSRHTYGDAADVFVDRDGDGRMDDLDGDGKSDTRDAEVLYQIAEKLTGREFAAGGLGIYGPKPHRGPFLHLDTRGYPARWQG